MHYRVNEPNVIAETIGGETIIVNLTKGHYYNLEGSGVEIWERIVRGESVEDIIQALDRRYDAPHAEVRDAVERLVGEFCAEELIVVSENGSDRPVPTETVAGVDRFPFTKPSLAKFTDMQDIILLDPVHEVDARGWPHASAGA